MYYLLSSFEVIKLIKYMDKLNHHLFTNIISTQLRSLLVARNFATDHHGLRTMDIISSLVQVETI